MDNIDKTLILSYPRTGSTALLDVYRKYLEKTYPNQYLNMPSEPMEEDQFFNLTDYSNLGYPFHKFCEKYNIPKIELNNVLEYKQSLNMNKVGDSIFQAILSEPFFVTKIFPSHIDYYPDYMTNVLLNHINSGNNLICLYRRNFLDTISSIITCTWSNRWVNRTPRDKDYFITAEMVDIQQLLVDENLQPIRNIINGLRIWYQCYISIANQNSNFKCIAYEDIESFDSSLLLSLHGVNTYNIKTCVSKQHDKKQQVLVYKKYKHLIDQVLTDDVMKTLPLNESYEVVL